MKDAPLIVGAGLAGLIAAHAWPSARVVERSPQPTAIHRALLRFRSSVVGSVVGIEFAPVTVRKAIFAEGRHQQPNIRLANQYATKVTGRVSGDRSIWNLQEAQRFVAPDDFYERLVTSVGSRIAWGTEVDFSERRQFISTAPLPSTLAAVGVVSQEAFERAPITVARFFVAGADVYQTVYFPLKDETPMYRASMTGSTLIVEAMATDVDPKHWLPRAILLCERAFGIDTPELLGVVDQKYGKIVPITDAARKRLLFGLTQMNNIYSLGRFATWRNILLDDVVKDISVIKRLLNSELYDVKREVG